MADFGMWGAEQSGTRLALKDQQASALNEMSLRHTAGQLAMMPAQQALAEAHAKLYGAEAEGKQLDVDIRKRLAGQLSQMGAGGGTADYADYLERLGMAHLQAGAFEQGRHLIDSAASYRLREARAGEQKVLAERNDQDRKIKAFEAISNAVGAVTDQPSLDRMLLQAQSIGLPTQMIPRDFESARPVLQQLSQSTLKAADRIRIGQREVEQALRLRAEGDREATSATTRALNTARRTLTEERTEALRKNGGKPIGAPSVNEVGQALEFVKQQLKGSTAEAGDLAAGASELAGTARGLMKQNPALTYPQALAQSFDPQDWSTEKPRFGSPKAKYAGSGKTENTALPTVPEKPEGRREGRFYQTPKGVYQWTKQGWKKPAGGVMAAPESDETE